MYSDPGLRETDEILRKTEKEITEVYKQAQKELEEKARKRLKDFERLDDKMQKRVHSGSMTISQYNKWRQTQLMYSQWANDMRNVIATDLANANQIAMSIVNGHTPEVYAVNMNYGTYEIEQIANVNTNFTLYNAQTVESLIRDDPDLLPVADPNTLKDVAWNKKLLTSAMIQTTLQGESINELSERLKKVVGMNHSQAVRSARTMTTAAQSIGRNASMSRAKGMGIDVKKTWMARLDFKTRHSHRLMDGEERDPDKPFSNGLMMPGDMEPGLPEEVYNCRCRLIQVVDGYNPLKDDGVRANKLEGMSYEDWKAGKKRELKQQTKQPLQEGKVVNGKDLTGTWKRRPDKFDFEIEDVINAQGFDGLPRVVSKEEFDKAVQESSFIAQRTYSGKSPVAVKGYQDELYHGKWYVDCGTGGAQYGRGMYCAADYTGTLSHGIKTEMRHYQGLNITRGNPHYITETLTIDPTAKIVTYKEISLMRDKEVDSIRESIRQEIKEKNLPMERAREALANHPNYVQIRNMDLGTYAAMKGYDAINAEGHGASGSYTVILNRTKVILLGGQ